MSDEAELPLVRRNGKSEAAFRTISEVAEELDVPQHVLRFWESKFPQVKPLKRGGGRRYYRPEDVALLKRIRDLLYSEGYTIKGVQKLLREGGHKEAAVPECVRPDQGGAPDLVLALDGEDEGSEFSVMDDGEEGGEEMVEPDEPEQDLAAFEPPAPLAPVHEAGLSPELRAELKIILGELEQMRALLAPR